jgi:hypothetical protein
MLEPVTGENPAIRLVNAKVEHPGLNRMAFRCLDSCWLVHIFCEKVLEAR